MKQWLQGTSDDPVELKHMTYNFTKAHHHYINGGDSCKTWTESSSVWSYDSVWPYGTCTTYRTPPNYYVWHRRETRPPPPPTSRTTRAGSLIWSCLI